jgi:hypothetical protein
MNRLFTERISALQVTSPFWFSRRAKPVMLLSIR